MPVKLFSPMRVNFMERMRDTEPSWLVSKCIAGDEEAIEMLVRQYETGVFRLALSIVGDQAAADEITQETFIEGLALYHCIKPKPRSSTSTQDPGTIKDGASYCFSN